MPKLNLGSVDLPEDEYDWMTVIINLSGEPLRSQMRQIIKGHLIRFKSQYVKQLHYTAKKYGLTPEETFKRLLKGPPPFGDVVNEGPINFDEELTNFGCEVNKEVKQDGSVNPSNGDADT